MAAGTGVAGTVGKGAVSEDLRCKLLGWRHSGFSVHNQAEAVKKELTRAGYVLAREHAFLPNQYFLEFVPAGR